MLHPLQSTEIDEKANGELRKRSSLGVLYRFTYIGNYEKARPACDLVEN